MPSANTSWKTPDGGKWIGNQYIMENPRRWQMDREKEARSASDPLAQAIRNMPKQEEADHSLGGEP
jgi:hypothetical protein